MNSPKSLLFVVVAILTGCRQSLAQGPPNDLCTAAESISSSPFNGLVDTTSATPDGSLPICDPVSADDKGVWYVLPGNDKIVNVELSTTGITGPKIAVFAGSCGNLTCVTSIAGRSLSWEGKLGTEYRILLTGNGGEINFMVEEETPPPNDKCENAIEFISLPASEFGTTVGSLSDGINVCSTPDNNRGVWYTFVPVIDSFITISTTAADFPHEIVLFSGDSCGSATCDGMLQSASFGGSAQPPSFTFIAAAGTKYYILVTGWVYGTSDAFKSAGTFSLNVVETPRPPNDTCENATEFLSLPVVYEMGSTVGALPDEAFEICSSSFNTRGVWYALTPAVTGNFTITTSAANFQHEIVLYYGETCATAMCNGNQAGTFGSTSSTTFINVDAVAGTKYYVLVTGYRGTGDAYNSEGTFALSITGNQSLLPTPVSAPVTVPTGAPAAIPVTVPFTVAPVAVPAVMPTFAPVVVPVPMPTLAPVDEEPGAVPVIVTASPVMAPSVTTKAPVRLAPSLSSEVVSSAPFVVMYWTSLMTTMVMIFFL